MRKRSTKIYLDFIAENDALQLTEDFRFIFDVLFCSRYLAHSIKSAIIKSFEIHLHGLLLGSSPYLAHRPVVRDAYGTVGKDRIVVRYLEVYIGKSQSTIVGGG